MSSLYPSISLANYAVVLLLYKHRTFLCPITRVSLGVTMVLVGRWASRGVWPIVNIMPLQAPKSPLESLIAELSVVYLTYWVFTEARESTCCPTPLTRNCSQAEGLFLTLGPKWGTRSLSKVIIRRPLHEGLFDSKHLYMKYLSIICSLKFSLKREWSFSWKRKLDWISSNTTCSWWSWQIPRKIVLHNKCCSTLPCFYRDEISINRRHNEYQLHLEKQYFNRRRIHRKEKDGDRYIDL